MNNFKIELLTTEQKETRKRILEISYHKKFSHLGSCFSSIDLIDAIYKIKNREEKFVLSNGHAGVALYVILEKNGFIKSADLEKLNVHPDRNISFGIDASTGSLGQGLPIALGMAIANRNKNVYCIISDGECAEGSIWEALKIAHDNKVINLKIIVNANGWSAYDAVDTNLLAEKIKGFGFSVIQINGHYTDDILKTIKSLNRKRLEIILAKTSNNQFPFLKNLDAHYYTMTENDFKKGLELLK